MAYKLWINCAYSLALNNVKLRVVIFVIVSQLQRSISAFQPAYAWRLWISLTRIRPVNSVYDPFEPLTKQEDPLFSAESTLCLRKLRYKNQELVLVRNFDFRSILRKTLKQRGVKIEIKEPYLSVLSLLAADKFVQVPRYVYVSWKCVSVRLFTVTTLLFPLKSNLVFISHRAKSTLNLAFSLPMD